MLSYSPCAVAVDSFHTDLAQLSARIAPDGPSADAKLGDVIQFMARKGLLLTAKKNDNFDIVYSLELSEETRNYLNVLQTEKFYQCRRCYHQNADERCAFHKKYVYCGKNEGDEYVQFLNSEMGIISFVELYYSYLSVEFWCLNAPILFKDLTGFTSVRALLEYYNYNAPADVDKPHAELMNEDERAS